ncbi:MAG TPA: OmpA family protein [Terriglobia bacterium]|nr:OmpA family protein [Terriglobia bacterium]
MVKYLSVLLALFIGSIGLFGQTAANDQQPDRVPIYRVTVVARTTKAINYRHRSEFTKVDFRGTSLMPEALGEADVQSKQGAIKVDAKFRRIAPASRFGPEYMTYVLWAISPEGRPVNLGEVLPDNNGNSRLQVTSDLQTFGLIVTAEPHFAVTQPSDVVVMENFVTNETNGTIEEVDAKYELLKRGQYTVNANPAELTVMALDARTPIELYEARNAIRIAKWAGAETYAADTLQKAEGDLQNAEGFLAAKGNRKDLITDAREAAQMAEDARLISVRKMEAEEHARERKDAADARATAEAQSLAATQAKEQAEHAAQERAAADAAKLNAEAKAEQERQTAEAARQAAEQERLNAAQAQQNAQQAESEKVALRAQLQQQFNSILATRDTARGLIMNMSDVLFDTGKYTLKPIAREKLARVSGILVSHQGLSLEIDGYTDSVGGDEYNQTLSENRARAVRDYLATQGVPPDSIVCKGFGKTNPVASNDNSQGRQQNRRVELVVSGDAIKAQLGSSTESH